MKSSIKYQFSNDDFNKLEYTGGFYRNNLILLVGNKLLKDGTLKSFKHGWYDTNLILISDITADDLQQIKEWGDIPY